MDVCYLKRSLNTHRKITMRCEARGFVFNAIYEIWYQMYKWSIYLIMSLVLIEGKEMMMLSAFSFFDWGVWIFLLFIWDSCFCSYIEIFNNIELKCVWQFLDKAPNTLHKWLQHVFEISFQFFLPYEKLFWLKILVKI